FRLPNNPMHLLSRRRSLPQLSRSKPFSFPNSLPITFSPCHLVIHLPSAVPSAYPLSIRCQRPSTICGWRLAVSIRHLPSAICYFQQKTPLFQRGFHHITSLFSIA